jgi:putative hydrolase
MAAMAEEGPSGVNPFEGMPIFGDLARMFSQQGPVNWDVARQIAHWLATDGQSEPNVEPIERMHFEELLRVAELRVADTTGLATSTAGGIVAVAPMTRGQWASRALDDHRRLLERLATGLQGAGGAAGTEDVDAMGGPDPTAGLLGDLGQMMAPVLLGMQSGFMTGHLAKRALGQYDLPIPRPPSDELAVVPANIDAFAGEWSLPVDDVRLWVCLREVSYHAVLGRPHVRAALDELLDDYVSGFEVNTDALESSFGSFDPADPAGLQELLGNPETLLGALQTDQQRRVLGRIETLTTVMAGYVDQVMDTVGTTLIGTYPMLTEALRRRRVEATEADKFVERLLGLELGQTQYQRGAAFARGVVERAGIAGLNRLWDSEELLPTTAEVDAPGLWLARIDLPED